MKRWPVVRHIRFLYLRWRFESWWLRCGRYYWLAPNVNDEEYLDAVWRGEA